MTGPYTQLTAEQITEKLRGIRDAQPIDDQGLRRAAWERCWKANDFPPYFSENEHERFVTLRDGLFAKYFDGIPEIVEFGCGLGENLLSRQLAGRRLRGYDWSQAAVDKCRTRGIEAEVFDMFNPAPVRIEGCGVFTVHALEQLGANWFKMAYLLRSGRPKVVVHIEPVVELYDPLDLDDYLAIQYHNARGYLRGYLPTLKMWPAFVEILEVTKSPFGNINHKAYSVVCWRPR